MPYRRELLIGAFVILLVALVAPALDRLPGPIAILLTIACLAAAGIFIVDIPGSISRGKVYRAGDVITIDGSTGEVLAGVVKMIELARIEAESAAYVAQIDAETAAIEAETDAYVAKSQAETAAIHLRTALIEIDTVAIDAWKKV